MEVNTSSDPVALPDRIIFEKGLVEKAGSVGCCRARVAERALESIQPDAVTVFDL